MSERHNREFNRTQHPPSRRNPESGSPQGRRNRHYEGYQNPHVRQDRASSHHSRDPRQYVHNERTEQPKYQEYSGNSQFSNRNPSLHTPRFQSYTRRYKTQPDTMNHRIESGIDRGRGDVYLRSLDVRDGRQREPIEYEQRGGYREEYQGSKRESSREYSPRHTPASEGEHVNRHYQHYGGSGYHEPPPGSQNEATERWEEDIQNMLPSQVDINKGKLDIHLIIETVL